MLQSFQIEKGKTTEADLIANFGQPATTMMQGDGTKTLTWSGAVSQSHDNYAGMVIPFAPVEFHQDVHSLSLQATVKDGIVVDFTRTDSNYKPIDYKNY